MGAGFPARDKEAERAVYCRGHFRWVAIKRVHDHRRQAARGARQHRHGRNLMHRRAENSEKHVLSVCSEYNKSLLLSRCGLSESAGGTRKGRQAAEAHGRAPWLPGPGSRAQQRAWLPY